LVTGGDLALGGLLVTNVAWFVALWLLYRLAQHECGEQKARGAVVGMALFPTAFFGFVPYPEALFLALGIGAILRMREGCWHWAAVLGMLAALTKQNGLLLVIPFLWEYGVQHGWDVRWLARGGDWRKAIGYVQRDAWWICAVPAGTALYMLYLWRTFGDPLLFARDETHWTRTTMWPWQTLWRAIQDIPLQPTPFLEARLVEEVVIVLAVGALLGLSWQVLPKSDSLLGAIAYLFFLSHPTSGWIMDSQARYMLAIFPIFVTLGALFARRRWLFISYLAICAPAQIVLLALFVRHAWVI
jgi:hypothetical protein